MKRWFEIFGWVMLVFVLLMGIVAFVWWGESTRAASPQVVVELPCPSGYNPVTGFVMRNPSTDALRYLVCQSPTGNILIVQVTTEVQSNFQVGGLLTTSPSGVSLHKLGWVSSTFSSLGAELNGTMRYCGDCTIANPCAGGGTGAIAKRLNGAWVCN